MELTPEFAPEDVISKMPDNVIAHILDRLPIQHAVRTSILSRNWRFSWTTLSQLGFDNDFFKHLTEKEGENSYRRIINWLLLHINGFITKFVIYIEERFKLDVEDINYSLLLLSKRGIKDLTFYNVNGPQLKLPTHLFSCLELTRLELVRCCLDPPSSFHGFQNLSSLEFRHVQFESGKFGELFNRSPVLETLNMGYTFYASKVTLVEIAKLTNLKILSLFLCNLDKAKITCSGCIFELVSSLPKLQELHLDFIKCKFTECSAENKKRFPNTFPCFKTLKLSRIYLGTGMNLSCAFEMISSFPNLRTLEITTTNWEVVPTPGICSAEVDYDTTGRLQLRSVVFMSFIASEDELCLIKYLLASSPFLKRFVIRFHLSIASDEKMVFARKLLKLNRASPVVDIDLC